MALSRANYEQIYLSSLRFEPEYGPLSDKYDVMVQDLTLHRQEQRSWAVVRFTVASMPVCVFARAGSSGHDQQTGTRSGKRQLFSTYLVEILDARGWTTLGVLIGTHNLVASLRSCSLGATP